MAISGDTNNDGYLDNAELNRMSASQLFEEQRKRRFGSFASYLNPYNYVSTLSEAINTAASPESTRNIISAQQTKQKQREAEGLASGADSSAFLRQLAGGVTDPVARAKEINARELAALKRYGSGGDGGYAAGMNRSLANYIANMLGYSKAQGRGIAQAYENLAGEAESLGNLYGARGAGAGADVTDIYNQLANTVADYSAGQGMATPSSEIAGMVGPSGAMAEAPAGAVAQGASLANYLGEQGTAARDLANVIGTAYRGQGVGTAAEMLNAAQYAVAQRRAATEQAIAQQRAASAGRYNDMLRQAALSGLERITQAEAAKETAAAAGRQAAAMAESVWDKLPSKTKKDFKNSLLVFRTAMQTRPDLLPTYQLQAGQ